MSMLDRIKKRKLVGFKEFVVNLETSSPQARSRIFLAGLLEDPVFMIHAIRNIRHFESIFGLSSKDLNYLLTMQDQAMSLFAKSIISIDPEKITIFEETIPEHMSNLKKELSLLKDVSWKEQEAAQLYLLKLVRKFQTEERIVGFEWNLPPQEIFTPPHFKDGNVKIFFDNGKLAAQGFCYKNKRLGAWTHYYETGALFAEGHYLDGVKNDEWTFYFTNGNMKGKGQYVSDLRHGLWKEWDREGRLTELEYDEGIVRPA